jgi:hypothetical protein
MANNPLPVARTRISIGGPTADYTQTALAADTYKKIGGVRSVPGTGDTYQSITVEEVEDARARFAKGTASAQAMDIVCSRRATDVGQIACQAAADSLASFNFKIEEPNADGTFSVTYISALVMGKPRGRGGPNDTQTVTFTLQPNEAPIEVVAP